jgi:hypothetical protein
MPPKRHNELGPAHRQHRPMVCEGRRVPHLSRSFRNETSVGVLDRDQLYIWHGDEVAKVGGVVERMPVAYLDCGDANGHERPLRGLASYPKVPFILASMGTRGEVETRLTP